MTPRSTPAYQTYAEIYDAFKGDRSANIAHIKKLIQKYQPEASRLLDLACGTGSIAQGLMADYEVWGLDKSAHMLRIARKKLPNLPLLQADMAGFGLGQTFDVVYCLHNSMNHLLTLEDWARTFRTVAQHLAPGGVFIFDCNPLEKMQQLAASGPALTAVGQDYVITQVLPDPEGSSRFLWDVKMLSKQQGDKFVMRQEIMPVSAYSLEQVAVALAKNFTVADYFVRASAEMPDDVGRAYYIGVKQ